MPDLDFFNIIDPLSLEEIAHICECQIYTPENASTMIKGVAPIDTATSDDITFLSNKKYSDSLKSSKAGACILHEDSISKAPDGMILLVSKNPYASYAKIANAFYPTNNDSNISPQAYIDASAKIGEGCSIEAGAYIACGAEIGNNCQISSGAYIGKKVKIGNNCIINHGVTVRYAALGNNVILHPGAKVGQDGFGFATEKGVHIKVPQLGLVIIKDDVEVGANSCIDRGAAPNTIIGEGTKIDNLVQIGHNVQMGKGCIVVSQAGIAGSTKLGDYVVLGGQTGVAGHLNIGSMVSSAARSGITNDVPANETVGGYPCVPIREWHKQSIAIKKLVKNKRLNND